MNDDQAAESLGLPLSPPRRTTAAIKGSSAGTVGGSRAVLGALGLPLSPPRRIAPRSVGNHVGIEILV